MRKYPLLSVISNTQEEISYPTYEDSREYQAKLMGLWEQQQRVLGYTESTIALGINCLNEFLEDSNKFIWEFNMSDGDVATTFNYSNPGSDHLEKR